MEKLATNPGARTKQKAIAGGVLLIALIALVGYLWYAKAQSGADTSIDFGSITTPGEELPQTNPFEQLTNPFTGYKNPFE